MKRTIPAFGLILLAACSTLTIGVAVSSIGIAGAAFEAYCATSSANCTAQEIGLGVAVVAESVNEESVLLSGATTSTVITQTIANLNSLLAQAKVLPQTAQVAGVEAAIQVAIPLIESLVAAATTSAAAPHTVTMIHMQMTGKDRSALAKMDAKIAALKH